MLDGELLARFIVQLILVLDKSLLSVVTTEDQRYLTVFYLHGVSISRIVLKRRKVIAGFYA